MANSEQLRADLASMIAVAESEGKDDMEAQQRMYAAIDRLEALEQQVSQMQSTVAKLDEVLESIYEARGTVQDLDGYQAIGREWEYAFSLVDELLPPTDVGEKK